MDSEIRDLASLLDQISTLPISKVREMCRLAKGVLVRFCPKIQKTNSTKRDKLYWEHVSIAHRKIQKSSGSSSDSGSGSRRRGRLPRAPRGRGRGRSSGRSSLSYVIDPSPYSTFSYIDAFPSFVYLFIQNWKNLNGGGNYGYRVVADFVFGDEHQWYELDTPDCLYVIANAFNLCVVLIVWLGSMTVLPLYLYSDCTAATNARWMFIAPFTRAMGISRGSDQVSGCAEAYFNRIADWNTRYVRAYLLGDPIHVNS
ncbi:hypothetical protein M9H77_14548 [Catharanthus roseus]|uniref:Uncharacterized protein n=1 Tax=Catharanthus roseus TaxID=4058 RepID=A0ACC0BNL9_CATRO|nr:hypothetical protein M9H77_14548 [Catharanthus roseus]